MKFEIFCLNEILKSLFFFPHETPLYTAVKKGNIQLVSILITNENVDVNISGILIINFNRI